MRTEFQQILDNMHNPIARGFYKVLWNSIILLKSNYSKVSKIEFVSNGYRFRKLFLVQMLGT
jgi:hypothetical protein